MSAQEINRLQKVLEGANLQLAAVASDVLGKSGRDMLEAVIDGEQDAEALAELARGKLRAKLPALRQALAGRVQPHHWFLLERILAHIDFLEESIAHIQQQVAQRLGPYEEAMTLLQSIPGIQEVAAAIISEIGVEMERFPSAKHLARLRWGLPGEQTKRRQAAQRSNAHGEHLFTSDAGRSSLDHLPHEGYLSGGPVPSHCAKTRKREGHCRRLPQSAGDHLPCLTGEETLHRSRS